MWIWRSCFLDWAKRPYSTNAKYESAQQVLEARCGSSWTDETVLWIQERSSAVANAIHHESTRSRAITNLKEARLNVHVISPEILPPYSFRRVGKKNEGAKRTYRVRRRFLVKRLSILFFLDVCVLLFDSLLPPPIDEDERCDYGRWVMCRAWWRWATWQWSEGLKWYEERKEKATRFTKDEIKVLSSFSPCFLCFRSPSLLLLFSVCVVTLWTLWNPLWISIVFSDFLWVKFTVSWTE